MAACVLHLKICSSRGPECSRTGRREPSRNRVGAVTLVSEESYRLRLKLLYGAFQHVDRLGLLYTYRNKLPHSSPEAPRIIQMRETSTSEGGNYSPPFC
jgi:hypothetical protein